MNVSFLKFCVLGLSLFMFFIPSGIATMLPEVDRLKQGSESSIFVIADDNDYCECNYSCNYEYTGTSCRPTFCYTIRRIFLSSPNMSIPIFATNGVCVYRGTVYRTESVRLAVDDTVFYDITFQGKLDHVFCLD